MRRPAASLALTCALAGAACGDTTPPFFVETLIAGDTTDGTGAYSVTTVVRDDRRVAWVRLSYQVGLAAAPITVELAPGEATDLWVGSIPGPGRQTRIYYSLEAADNDGNRGRDPALAPDTYSFAIEPRPPLRLDASVEDTVEAGPVDAHGEDAGIEDAGAEDGGPTDASDAAAEDHPFEDARAPEASIEDGAGADAPGDA